MRLRLLAPLAVVLALDVGPRPASAQDALTLFERGRALLAQKRTREACLAFADAHRLQPDAVGITLNLAECFRDLGKLASSYSTYRQAELLCKKTGERERERYAHESASALEPRLAHLRIVAPAVPGLVLRRDGEDLGQTALVAPFPIDAGDHRIELSAPGYRPWSAAVKVPSDGASVSLEAPALVPDGSHSFVWTPARYAGLGIGIAGVAALAAGGAVGGAALSKYNAAKPDCSPSQPDMCTAAGVSTRSSALHLADASTGLLIGGAVATAAGVTLLLVPPSGGRAATGWGPKIEASPLAGAGTAGLLLRGAW
jgi:hypothetical protein